MTELVVAGMLMFSQRDSNMPEALGARIRGDLWTLTSTPGAGGLSVDPTHVGEMRVSIGNPRLHTNYSKPRPVTVT